MKQKIQEKEFYTRVALIETLLRVNQDMILFQQNYSLGLPNSIKEGLTSTEILTGNLLLLQKNCNALDSLLGDISSSGKKVKKTKTTHQR